MIECVTVQQNLQGFRMYHYIAESKITDMLYGALVGLVVGLVIVAIKAIKQKKDNK